MEHPWKKVQVDSEEHWRQLVRPSKKIQFGLVWLFVGTTLLAVCLAPYVWKTTRLRRQQYALEQLGEYGQSATLVDGWVRSIDLGYRPESVNGDVEDAPEIDLLMGYLELLPALEQIDLTQSRLGMGGIRQLAKRGKLKELILLNVNIGDDELAQLADLKNLEKLNLCQTKITDAGLIHLKRITNLRELELSAVGLSWANSRPQITDAGVAVLRHLSTLERLSLSQSFITDRAVEELAQLNGLRDLDISGTFISSQGIQELRQALPNCTIVHGAMRGWKEDQLFADGKLFADPARAKKKK